MVTDDFIIIIGIELGITHQAIVGLFVFEMVQQPFGHNIPILKGIGIDIPIIGTEIDHSIWCGVIVYILQQFVSQHIRCHNTVNSDICSNLIDILYTGGLHIMCGTDMS
jgi:hypothetical protein